MPALRFLFGPITANRILESPKNHNLSTGNCRACEPAVEGQHRTQGPAAAIAARRARSDRADDPGGECHACDGAKERGARKGNRLDVGGRHRDSVQQRRSDPETGSADDESGHLQYRCALRKWPRQGPGPCRGDDKDSTDPRARHGCCAPVQETGFGEIPALLQHLPSVGPRGADPADGGEEREGGTEPEEPRCDQGHAILTLILSLVLGRLLLLGHRCGPADMWCRQFAGERGLMRLELFQLNAGYDLLLDDGRRERCRSNRGEVDEFNPPGSLRDLERYSIRLHRIETCAFRRREGVAAAPEGLARDGDAEPLQVACKAVEALARDRLAVLQPCNRRSRKPALVGAVNLHDKTQDPVFLPLRKTLRMCRDIGADLR